MQVGATEDDALVVDGVLGAWPVFADGARQLRHIAARGGRTGEEVHDDEQRQHQQAVLLQARRQGGDHDGEGCDGEEVGGGAEEVVQQGVVGGDADEAVDDG